MKKVILILLASIMMASCYKEDVSLNGTSSSGSNTSGSSGSSSTSHYCGYTTQKGTPCKRLVSGSSGYCWQHR